MANGSIERPENPSEELENPSEKLDAGKLVEARLIEMVFPEQANHYGTLFGGEALALMDKAAFIAASRYARRTVVTASSERVDFHVPVRQGQLVELVARVVSTGRTSMIVDVELWAEDLLTGDRRLGTRGRFVLVALDAHGKATAVPPLRTTPADDGCPSATRQSRKSQPTKSQPTKSQSAIEPSTVGRSMADRPELPHPTDDPSIDATSTRRDHADRAREVIA